MVFIGQAVWADIQPALGPAMTNGLVDFLGGSFQMGHKDAYFEEERIPHRVSVSDFKIGKRTVTNREYEGWLKALGENRFFLLARVGMGPYPKVLARANSKKEIEAIRMEKLYKQLRGIASFTVGSFQASSLKFLQVHEVPVWRMIGEPVGPEFPALGVSWLSAFLFANSMGLRLPTEAEFAFVQFLDLAPHAKLSGPWEIENVLGSEYWQWVADRSDSYPKKPRHNPTGAREWVEGVDQAPHGDTRWREFRLLRGGSEPVPLNWRGEELSPIQLANLRHGTKESLATARIAFRLAADRPTVEKWSPR